MRLDPTEQSPPQSTHFRANVRDGRGDVQAAWTTAIVAALLTIGLSLCAPALEAQSTPVSSNMAESPLLLGDLYLQVQAVNPRLQAARALTQAARARIASASLPPDPQVQLGLMNYSLPRLTPMPVLGMRQLQIMQMLPLGGKLSLAGRVADARASAANHRSEDVSWDLRAQSAMAFYDLYATDRGLVVARETLRLLQDIAATADAMYRVGTGRQADVLRARVEVARMVEDTLRMQAMRQAMASRIGALLDRGPTFDIGVPVLPTFPDAMPARAWLDSVARDGRPMIRAGLEEVRAADASARLARKEIFPDIQVGVQYGQQGGEMGTERMGSLMIGASIPIFARSRQLQMRVETEAMRQMAQADVAAMRAETGGRIGEAYAAILRARSLATLYRTTVLPEADATAASALSAYRVGGVDFMTLLDDRMTVNRYRQELNVLEAEQGKSWAELEMLVGTTLVDAPRRTGKTTVGPTMPTGSAR